MAMSGSTSEALSKQLDDLKSRVEQDGLLVQDNRLLVTLMIGANDLCMWDCQRPKYQLNLFMTKMSEFIRVAIVYFGRSNLKILIGEIPALEGIPYRAAGTGMEAFALLECPCAYRNGPLYPFTSRIQEYNSVFHRLASDYPELIWITGVLREEALKDWPAEMTSNLDRFHPSKWAHTHFARKIFQQIQEWDASDKETASITDQ